MRVGVLVSGTGSILQSIIDEQDDLYEVAVVVSDRPDVLALDRAAKADIPSVVVDWRDFGAAERVAFTTAVAEAISKQSVGLVCSAGFMKILAPNFFAEVGVPYINSHPALLPSFPGAHGVRDALAHGVKVTGTSIIVCDDGVDTGPIIAQRAVAIEEHDTEESLHQRIKVVEQHLFPEVIRLYAQGRVTVEGRRVRIR